MAGAWALGCLCLYGETMIQLNFYLMFYCSNGVRNDYVLLYLIKPDLLLSLSEWRD